MKKRQIDKGYLRELLTSEATEGMISASVFVGTVKRFAEEYLGGAVLVTGNELTGGMVSLRLPAVTYLIRLFCEYAKEDEVINIDFTLCDKLIMKVSFKDLDESEPVSELIKVGRLACFDVSRDDSSLIFESEIFDNAPMKIYAISSDELMSMLILTYKM